MVDLAPSLLKEGSSLDFHIIALILDDIMKRAVNTVRLDIDQLFIIDAGISRPAIYLRALCDIAVFRVVIKIQEAVFNIVSRIIFKYRRDIIVEMDPVLPVQEEYTDPDQVCHVFIIIFPVDILIRIRLGTLFADDLFQKMPCLFGPVTIGMNACLLNIIQIVIHKLFSDLL